MSNHETIRDAQLLVAKTRLAIRRRKPEARKLAGQVLISATAIVALKGERETVVQSWREVRREMNEFLSTGKKCKHCGKPGDCGGSIGECANCWEVRRRLRIFLQADVNVEFTKQLLFEVIRPKSQTALEKGTTMHQALDRLHASRRLSFKLSTSQARELAEWLGECGWLSDKVYDIETLAKSFEDLGQGRSVHDRANPDDERDFDLEGVQDPNA